MADNDSYKPQVSTGWHALKQVGITVDLVYLAVTLI